jgi:hypothetical protein
MNKFPHKLKLYFVPCDENKNRPSFLKSNFLFLVIMGLFFFRLILVSFTFYFPNSNLFSAVSRVTLISLTNQRRVSRGLNSLHQDWRLNRAASMKAQDMIRNDYFAHTSPSGRSLAYWISSSGYPYRYAGENLGMNFISSSELFNSWMASSSHRSNILSSHYQDIGIAVATGNFKGKTTTVVVQMFGSTGFVSRPVVHKTVARTTTQHTTTKKVETRQETTQPTTTQKRTTTPNEQKVTNTPTPTTKTTKTEGTIKKPKTTTKPSPTLSEEEKKILEEAKKGGQEPVFSAKEIKGIAIENNSFKFKLLDFIAKYGDNISQVIFLIALSIVVIALLLQFFIKVRAQEKDLILRGVLYIVVLLMLFLLDSAVIIKMIPHTLGIL